MLTNYHTHCYRCEHAEGLESDYINKAIEQGFDILGMSDHVPYRGNLEGYRMKFEEITDYIKTVRREAKKNSNKIEVLVGFESEYLSGKRKYYESLLTEYGADYLALGQHFFDYGPFSKKSSFFLDDTRECITYAKSVVEAMSTGYYAFVAHPDIVGINQFPWDKNMDEMTDLIVDAAVKYDIPLEVNANGIRRGLVTEGDDVHYMYPHYKFWEKVAEAKAKTIVSADCHAPYLLLDDDVRKTKEMAHNWGLNVIDVLPLGKNKK